MKMEVDSEKTRNLLDKEMIISRVAFAKSNTTMEEI